MSAGEHPEHRRIVVQYSRLLALDNRGGAIAFRVQSLTKNEMRDVKTRIHFQRFAQLRDSFIVAARIIVIGAQIRVDYERERIELDGSFSLGDRIVEPAQCGQSVVAVLLMRDGVIWIYLHCALKFPDRLREIEIVKPD